MAIEIKMRNDKWRIKIKEEEWEFNENEFNEELYKILSLKKKYGRINNL